MAGEWYSRGLQIACREVYEAEPEGVKRHAISKKLQNKKTAYLPISGLRNTEKFGGLLIK